MVVQEINSELELAFAFSASEFDGDVVITHLETDPKEDDEDNYCVSVVGKGNIDFYTIQTGF